MHILKIQKRLAEIERFLYKNPSPIREIDCFETQAHLPVRDAMTHRGYKPCKIGHKWGRPWGSAWFRLRFAIPENLDGLPVTLRVQTGGEAVLYCQGIPSQGLDRNRDDFLLCEKGKAGETHEILVEAGANNAFGAFKDKCVLSLAELCAVNQPVWDCWHTLAFLSELAQALPADSTRRDRLFRAINQAVDAFDLDRTDPAALEKSAKAALKAVAAVRAQPAEPSAPRLHLCGHSHIDVAWLWPIAETVRKCSRTFSTAVKYMERYPEYRFTQSQPQLYEFTKQNWPALYAKIKKFAEQGRWEPTGGMWVEADCNISGGEALARQFLLGQRFFEKEFGRRSEILWLPDVFGYSAAIPQIMRKAGCRYFLTQKLSWDDTNRMPHLRKALSQFRERDRLDDMVYLYGFGDGGGGPTPRMLEFARIGENLEGLPRLEHNGAEAFFRRVEQNAADLATWVGELYFELHRGTYTTQAANKKKNRRAEFLLRETEILQSIGMLDKSEYPARELTEIWKIVLKNQFHDIIPGSSIGAVYKDSDADYERVFAEAGRIRDAGLQALSAMVDTRGPKKPIFVFNALNWERSDIVEAPLPAQMKVAGVADAFGNDMPYEIVGPPARRRVRFLARNVPGIGYRVFRLLDKASADAEPPQLLASETKLENRWLRVEFDKQGLIRSIFDKDAGREIVPKGARANVFEIFEDKPAKWDAWDIDSYYIDKGETVSQLESISVASAGPLEAAVRIKRIVGASRIEQIVALGAESRKIEFRTSVDWREKERLLKVAFPTAINIGAPARATFEIQYGHVERPTHWNTSWDRARFETCAHKWVDLAETGYGVALLNDCKYGHDVKDGRLRLTLLRAPKHPDPNADIGRHEFAYAILPHAGDFRSAGVVREAYGFNAPMAAFIGSRHDGPLPAQGRLFSVDAPNVVIEAVKKAEDGGELIVRLYEAHNARTKATLRLPRPAEKVWECNLLEDNESEAPFDGRLVSFEIKPFEIKTFKVRF